MNLLIAYDGSHSAEAALDDLSRTGLPSYGNALVVSVAELWLPPPDSTGENDPILEELVEKYIEKGRMLLNHAEIMAKHAVARVRRILPGWSVNNITTYGSAGWEILKVAENNQPDLIITGAQGHSAFSRLILGSISLKVLAEASGSVRIARGKVEVDPAPCRIIIGFDGSSGSRAAVAAVAARNWPEDTEVKLITATDSIMPTAIERFIPSGSFATDERSSEHRWIEQTLKKAAQELQENGLSASYHILQGNPNEVLIREAENWHADSIFLGANAGGTKLQRFLLGSTSSAVAGRAGCSVEVVRRKK
ncbi:MAG: universal stress protein [Pyrinomonadaceae bacterium]